MGGVHGRIYGSSAGRKFPVIDVQRQMYHQDVLDRLVELVIEFTAKAGREWFQAVGQESVFLEDS